MCPPSMTTLESGDMDKLPAKIAAVPAGATSSGVALRLDVSLRYVQGLSTPLVRRGVEHGGDECPEAEPRLGRWPQPLGQDRDHRLAHDRLVDGQHQAFLAVEERVERPGRHARAVDDILDRELTGLPLDDQLQGGGDEAVAPFLRP